MACDTRQRTARFFIAIFLLSAWPGLAFSQDLDKKVQESMEAMLRTHDELSPKFAVATELLATFNKKPEDPGQPPVVVYGRVFLFQSDWKTKESSKSILYGVTWNPEKDASGINSTWEFQLLNGKQSFYYKGGLINQFHDISKLPEDKRQGENRRFFYKRFAPLAMPLSRYALYMTGNANEESLMKFALDAKTMNTKMHKGMIHADLYFDRNKATAPIYSTVVLDPNVGNMPVTVYTCHPLTVYACHPLTEFGFSVSSILFPRNPANPCYRCLRFMESTLSVVAQSPRFTGSKHIAIEPNVII
jgi:hypothetical protein